MKQTSILRIGFDDTDSPEGMCTTYLAYKMVDFLKKEKVEFLDYPFLIRFNPNIPWKTRGNGAVSITIKTDKPKKIKEKMKQFVINYSDTKNGANPGIVFYQNDKIFDNFKEFSNTALWKLIKRNDAKQFISKNNLESFHLGNGQGLVGAIGAIGYQFSDHTFELLSYRKKKQFGKKRQIKKENVKSMQEKTYPSIFNCFDKEKNRVLITPHGPDPVFYGIRGEDPKSVINASQMINVNEKLHGYMIFKTNQGTSDHLKNEINVSELKPYTSGIVTGIVSSTPKVQQGGHVIFSLTTYNYTINCAVYKPTKISDVSLNLIKGDKICVGGGIRKASKKHKRILNVEFIHVLKLVNNIKHVNPTCKQCNKKMKSKGKNQGFQCIKCGNKFNKKSSCIIPREIKKKMYIPSVSAHRHLTRPKQRIGLQNFQNEYDKSTSWFHVNKN